MAYPLFAPFFEDLNNTPRDLELLRQTAKNATALIQQTTQETAQPVNTSLACECGEATPTAGLLADEDGMVRVNIDALCCIFLAALIFGVLIGLKMAGSEAEDAAGNEKGRDETKKWLEALRKSMKGAHVPPSSPYSVDG